MGLNQTVSTKGWVSTKQFVRGMSLDQTPRDVSSRFVVNEDVTSWIKVTNVSRKRQRDIVVGYRNKNNVKEEDKAGKQNGIKETDQKANRLDLSP